MTDDLSGQVAIVTGGGRGVGRAIALGLAEAGAAVAVASRTAAQVEETVALIEKAGGRTCGLPTDVSDRQAVLKLIEETERQLGPVTLLVNNAALLVSMAPTWELDPDEWWRTVEVNLRGTFLCSHAVLPGMIARGSGRIINLSGGGGGAPWLEGSGYGASKAGILRLTDTLAFEARKQGVYVFALSPGLVQTDMGWSVERSREIAETGRYGPPRPFTLAWTPPEKAGQACVAIASGRLDTLTGRTISASDDLDDLARRTEEIQQQDLLTLRLRR